MTALPLLLTVLMAVMAWSAMGCYALRDFSYSRLEELCDRRRVPDRLRAIMTQQDQAVLVLEVLLTLATVGVALCLGWIVGLPGDDEVLAALPVFGQYALGLLAIVVVADLVPWVASRVASEQFLFRCWPLVQLLLWLCAPLLVLARAADVVAHQWSGRGEPEADDAAVIGEEIRTVVDEGTREGVLEQGAGAMIERVMEFQHEDVGAIMTPRTDMICIPVDSSLEEARQQLIESGHSRVPVIGESTDDIIGILYAKDLLRALEPHRPPGQPAPVLRDIVREPLHVPLTTQIPALLELLKREHVHIAIVVDEYGGVAGLVTMEDIVEEIVGEIADEYDDKHQPSDIVQVSEAVVDVDARVHLDDLNERFHYELPEDQEYDTIGGFLFSLVGRVPVPGETIPWGQWRFTVLDADQRRVNRVRIAPASAEAPHPSA
jgi:CBS domain containing-hemolysin-like protein